MIIYNGGSDKDELLTRKTANDKSDINQLVEDRATIENLNFTAQLLKSPHPTKINSSWVITAPTNMQIRIDFETVQVKGMGENAFDLNFFGLIHLNKNY